MFDNVGRTIQVFAKIVWYAGILLSFITLIVLVTICATEDSPGLILLGVFAPVIGVFTAWVNSILLYGFGSLIENSAKIAENTDPELNAEASYVPLS